MSARTEAKKTLESMRDDLLQLRDTVRLKAHLGTMELRDQLERIEPDVRAFERRVEKAGAEAGSELKESWAHLKRALERMRDELEAS